MGELPAGTAKKLANEEDFVLDRLKSVAAQCKVSDEMMKNAPGKFIQCMDNELRKRSENLHDIVRQCYQEQGGVCILSLADTKQGSSAMTGNPTSTPTGPTVAVASSVASSSNPSTTT